MWRGSIWSRRAVAIVLISSVAGAVGISRSEPASAARGGRLVPANGALFGAWMLRDTNTSDATKAMVLNREAQMGRRFDTINRFYTWGATFPTWAETWDVQMGRTPMISWNGTTLTTVTGGTQDAMIRTRARAVAALGVDVFIRWDWEMDAGGGTPAQFIAAWKRIRSLFNAEGATNVAWVWCPTAWGFEQGYAQQWYPGDAEVDWMCSDGYNWAPTMPDSTWRMWEPIYRDSHDFAVAHNKPLMAGEWGAIERNAGEKAAWYNDARQAIKSMPNIAAIIAFDERRYRTDINAWMDWRVDSTASSLAAYTAWAADPYYNPGTSSVSVTIAAGDATIYETDGADVTVEVPITLSAPSTQLITVTAQTAAVTASSTDFVSDVRYVKFNPGVVRIFMSVKVRADTIDEANETVNVVLTSPGGASISDGTGAITIIDDDPGSTALRMAIGNASISEGSSEERSAHLAVTLSRDATADVVVNYTVTSTSAVRNTDWAGAVSGTFTFKVGQNLKTINVRIIPDFLTEANEVVTVTLSGAAGATISDGSGTITIVDDD
jgi:carbon monoxide dehydrogenase subunit G